MKYFILETERKNSLPEIYKWFGTLSPESNKERFSAAPTWIMLDADIRERTLYADLLSFPCMLLTEKVLQVFRMYHSPIPTKKTILINKKNQMSFFYYLAELPVHFVLSEASELDRVKSNVIHGVLDKEKVKGIPFFLIGEVSSPALVVKEDVAESLIRRNVRGIKLLELEVK